KQTPFQINRDFVQLDIDKEIENLFPEECIKAVNVQFPNWFDTYSEGLDGKITVFEIKSDRKSNVRKIFTDRLNQEISSNWSERWATLFEKIEFILASKKKGLVEIPPLNVEEEYPKPAKVTTSVNPSKRDEWFKMYQQLLDYREQFNHINVPRTDKVFVELGKWVSGQRSAYKKGILQSEFVSKLVLGCFF
ncbi:MAG: helicase associated domain-containing protein, partial [Flammeovirgaceae bacterium]